MSPARSKRQAPIPHRRSRADIVKAVAVAAGIVLGTALLVWLMRPGPAGIPATGGLINRQPRSSWLVGVALGVAGLATWLAFRSRRTRNRLKVVLPIELGVVTILAVVGGFMWPGGLLRHDVAPKPAPTTSTTTTKPGKAATTTSNASGTSTTGGSATTTTPGATSTTTATTSGAASTTTPATTATTTPSVATTTSP